MKEMETIEQDKQLNNNPRIMDRDEYLAKYSLASPFCDYTIDKMRCNNQIRTERGRKRFEKECDEALVKYHEKRNAKIAEYEKLVHSGQIRPRTPIERTVLKAHGNPERSDVQAARRICAKRGINWRTGKALATEDNND